MKIWIDADACPGAVKDVVLKAAHRLAIETVFVANKPLFVPDAPHLSFVLAKQGPDEADQHIIDHAMPGDLVITQDIPLASALLSKGATVISPHGTLYTEANMGDRLATRNLMQDLRDAGSLMGGPKPFGEKEKRQFANAFDQTLTRLRNRNSR